MHGTYYIKIMFYLVMGVGCGAKSKWPIQHIQLHGSWN